MPIGFSESVKPGVDGTIYVGICMAEDAQQNLAGTLRGIRGWFMVSE